MSSAYRSVYTMKLKKVSRVVPLSVDSGLAPLFTVDFYDKWFNCYDKCAGIEFEYSNRIDVRSIRVHRVGNLAGYATYLLTVMNRYDASGANEISVPPCSIVTEDEAYRCAQTHLLFIDFLGLPIPDTQERSGRHIHVTRPQSDATYDALKNFGRQSLIKFYTVTIPFSASSVSVSEDGMYVFKLREYVLRYASLNSPFDDHHAAYSISRRWRTLELRWNELPTTSIIPFIYLFAHSVLYGTYSVNDLYAVINELYDRVKQIDARTAAVNSDYFDVAESLFRSLSLHKMAKLIKLHGSAINKLMSETVKSYITNDVYMTIMADRDIFEEFKHDLSQSLSARVPLVTPTTTVLQYLRVDTGSRRLMPVCYFCYYADSYIDVDAEAEIPFLNLINAYIEQRSTTLYIR